MICTNCILDDSVIGITFNKDGVCQYCLDFQREIKPYWHPNSPESLTKLNSQVAKIKEQQKNQEYDVLLGLSGGVDSSYLTHWAVKEAGLRVCAIHIDAGWNSNIAVSNITKLVNKLNIGLQTIVVDWQAMREVQLAFIKSGVANCDTPQDHVFNSLTFDFAIKNNMKYILNGTNFATESILPQTYGHGAMDIYQIKDICQKFGAKNIAKYPFVGYYRYYFYYPYIKKFNFIMPLNYINFQKSQAIDFLQKEYDWQYYGGKHYESLWTKFFQGYWLFHKFGFDKRRAHLSSEICAGHLSRDDALKIIQQLPYDEDTIGAEKSYIAKKLGISVDDLDNFMRAPNKSYQEYANYDKHKANLYNHILPIWQKIEKYLKYLPNYAR